MKDHRQCDKETHGAVCMITLMEPRSSIPIASESSLLQASWDAGPSSEPGVAPAVADTAPVAAAAAAAVAQQPQQPPQQPAVL